MPRAARRASTAVAQLLRQKRQELGLTLRGVSDMSAGQGHRIPAATLARIEQGKLDPGVLRLHQLLRLYRVPSHLVADVVELEERAADQPVGTDPDVLLREGIEFWRKGDLSTGLGYLFAVRQLVADTPEALRLKQKATLGFAISARNLGKFRLALQIVEDLLVEPPHPSLESNVLVLASTIWQGLGSLPAAMAFIRQAEADLEPGDDEKSAWLYHQKGKLLVAAGKPKDAEEELDRAQACYRAAGDLYGMTRAALSRVEAVEGQRDLERAVACADEALKQARQHDFGHLVTLALVERGRLEVNGGRAEAALVSLKEGLARSVLRGDPHAEFTAHFYLWKAYERLGDRDRSRLELDAAIYFVRFVDDLSPEAEEIRNLPQGGRHGKANQYRD